MAAITQGTALWYASRATGVVSLLLLSAVVLLGVLVNRQGRLPGLPAFAVTGLHRSLSLLSLAFVGVHVATAIADPYVSIRAAAAVIPFVSAYEPFWLGLGAVALDLMAALVVTSLLRARLGRRIWRGVHWLAYLAWPVALAHGVGASPDLRAGGFRWLTATTALVVGAAALWRASRALGEAPRAERAAAAFARASLPPTSPSSSSASPTSASPTGRGSSAPGDGRPTPARPPAGLSESRSR